MRIRRFLYLTVLLSLAAGFLGAAEPLQVGVLRGPTAMAFAPLISDDTSTVNSRPLEFEIFPSPDVLVARIIAGDIDAAAIPSNLAAQLYNRGIDLQVVGTFIWGVLYIVGPPDALTGSAGDPSPLARLSGREVYAPGRAATPDLVLRYLVSRAGLEAAVSVRYGFSQVELAQLLIAGRLDFAVLPEPFVTRVLQATADRVVVVDLQEVWREETGREMPQTVLVTVGPIGAETQTALREALRGSVAELTSNPEVALAGVESLGLGLDTQTAVAALPRLNLRVESGTESRESLEGYFSVLEQFDQAAIGGSLPDAKFYGL
jgi:NitT/TauT family transport system substrate-binding protein